MDIVSIILILMILIIMIKGIYMYLKNDNPKRKNYKKKYHNPKNNYFRNNPEHIDMTNEYIEELWKENK